MTLSNDKKALRAAMIERRAAMPGEARTAAAHRLLDQVRRERPFPLPATVTGFWPMNEEIDLRPSLTWLAAQGCTIGLPIVVGRGKPLLFRRWQPGDALVDGVFGTQQPAADCPAVEPDALLVPLLACDGEGWRLGYGGGFYDRTLEALRARRPVTAVGVAYEGQVVPKVPRGPGDQRLDWLLTDQRACAFV